MILVNFTLGEYMIAVMFVFFFILLDVILTNINSRLYQEYHKIELIPWNKLIYKYLSGTVALVVSFVVNMLLFISFFFVPVSITWIVVFVGFMFYRVVHSGAKVVQYWRLMNHGK